MKAKANILWLLFGILFYFFNRILIIYYQESWFNIRNDEFRLLTIIWGLGYCLVLYFIAKEALIFSLHFNNRHPEKKHEEVFCCNIKYNDPEGLSGIGWKEKRKGVQAYYDTYGKKLNDSYPVFIKKAEVEQKIEEYKKIGVPTKSLKKMLR